MGKRRRLTVVAPTAADNAPLAVLSPAELRDLNAAAGIIYQAKVTLAMLTRADHEWWRDIRQKYGIEGPILCDPATGVLSLQPAPLTAEARANLPRIDTIFPVRPS